MDDYNLEIYKGATFSLSITLKDSDSVPLNLTSYNVSGYLKYRYADGSKLTDLNASKVAPYSSGVISLLIPSSGTERLPVGYCFYDVEIAHTGVGTVDKVLMGRASIFPEVTY